MILGGMEPTPGLSTDSNADRDGDCQLAAFVPNHSVHRVGPRCEVAADGSDPYLFREQVHDGLHN